jgi:pimeloyl-ACP methyl ester carboxylesterase
MGFSSPLRALGLLRRLGAVDPGPGAAWTEAIGGVPCDGYEPKRGPGTVIVALHGVTLNGKDDPRLRNFARALASTGATCVVPTLPALADVRWDGADVDALSRLIGEVARRTVRRVVIVGFSHGASLGLVAASRPETAPHVARVLSFGAYHSLTRAMAHPGAAPEPKAGHDEGWEPYVYSDLLCIHRHGAAFGLPAALRSDADDLLRRYCEAADLGEKRRFHEERLRPLGFRHGCWPAEPADVVAAVSPAGRLHGLTCPVDLVHDPDDGAVPASEAHALLAELRRAPGGGRHRLLVTRLVSHVTPSVALRPIEALRFLRMVAAMLEG